MASVDRRGVVVDQSDPATSSDPNPGLAIKVACRVATTGTDIDLSGLQTIDGIALNEGDRVLVKDQTDATENGIYNASSGNWTRATDANGNTELAAGLQVLVAAGALNGGYKTYILTSGNPVVIGTSGIVWQALAFPNSGIGFDLDGGGVPISTGFSAIHEVPFDCRIVRSTLLAAAPGNIVLDLRRTSYANFPPDPSDSIVGTSPPTLAGQQCAQDSALAGWTVQLYRGDLLALYVIGLPTVTKASLSLLVTRN